MCCPQKLHYVCSSICGKNERSNNACFSYLHTPDQLLCHEGMIIKYFNFGKLSQVNQSEYW